MADSAPSTLLRAFHEVPRHLVLRNFFDEDTTSALLAYAVASQSRFKQTGIGAGKEVNLSFRKSVGIRDLGDLRQGIKARLRALLPELIASLAVGEFELSRIELQLVAHGDGAFYGRHIDTFTGEESSDARHQRMISGVYYFNAQPKGFSGGELRLYPLVPTPVADDPPTFAEIQPEHNSLLVFPSWAAHEVRPVSCPSGRFIDSRFAINCWLCRAKPGV